MANAPAPSIDLTPTHVEAVTDFLTGAQITHTMVEHEPVMSAAAEARVTHRPAAEVAKTVILHDGSAYLITVIPATERLDLGKVRRLVGATRRLNLATEEQIARDFPTLEVGAIPPFGPMVPAAEFIDSRILEHGLVLCPAGDHRHSVLVDPQEIVRVTAARVGDICQDY